MVNLPDAYLVEIGKIAVQWTNLETVFELCLINVAGLNANEPRAWAIFAHMTFPQRLDVFGAMIDSLQDDYPRLQDYKAVRSIISEAQDGRNKVVHARWLYEDGKATITRLTARGKVKHSTVPITVDELRRIAELIGKASIELWKLVVVSQETLRNG